MNSIRIKKLIKFYFKKIIIFIIAMVITGIIGIVYTIKLKTPMYSSGTTMVLTKLERDNGEKETEGATNQTSNNTIKTNNTTNTKNVTKTENEKNKTNTMQIQEYEFDSYIVTDYCQLATRDKLLENVINKLGLNDTIRELEKKVTVTEVKGTNMFTIKAKYENPETAKNIVEALSEELQEKSREIYSINNIYDLQEAKVAEESYNVGIIKDLVIALFVGFLIAFIIVTLMYYFEDTDI